MRAPLPIWALRCALLLLAIAGPLGAWWLGLAATDDPAAAARALPFGFLASIAATVLFALTVQARVRGRLAWSFVFLTMAVAAWVGLLTLA